MESNPYQPPNAVGDDKPPSTAASRDAQGLLTIVSAQRGMMWLFLLKMGAEFSYGLAGEYFRGWEYLRYLLVFGAIQLAVSYFIFRIMREMYGIGPAFACAIFAFVPCIGSLTVLVLNGNVVDYVRKKGVRLGFMGATRQQLEGLRQECKEHRGAASK